MYAPEHRQARKQDSRPAVAVLHGMVEYSYHMLAICILFVIYESSQSSTPSMLLSRNNILSFVRYVLCYDIDIVIVIVHFYVVSILMMLSPSLKMLLLERRMIVCQSSWDYTSSISPYEEDGAWAGCRWFRFGDCHTFLTARQL